MLTLTAAYADTCLPDYWSGHHLPHISVPVYKNMPLNSLKTALRNELLNGAIMIIEDDNTAWYDAAKIAVDNITSSSDILFSDLDDTVEDDSSESVYAYFVFISNE